MSITTPNFEGFGLPIFTVSPNGEENAAISAILNEARHVYDWHKEGIWKTEYKDGFARLLTPYLQTIQPSYTAKKILGIEGDDVFLVARELGFANLSIGAVGLASIYFNEWTLAGALSGGLFYGFAGISHVLHKKRNTLQNVAMVTDLLAATLLLSVFMLTMLAR
jgi:hypothetical protein